MVQHSVALKLVSSLVVCVSCVAAAQNGQRGTTQPINPPQTSTTPSSLPTGILDDPPAERNAKMEANLEKVRNLDRQKKLVDDTQKLLALANELKSDVDKSTKDTLSLDVIKKADEIEKLAHSVKERMKGT